MKTKNKNAETEKELRELSLTIDLLCLGIKVLRFDDPGLLNVVGKALQKLMPKEWIKNLFYTYGNVERQKVLRKALEEKGRCLELLMQKICERNAAVNAKHLPLFNEALRTLEETNWTFDELLNMKIAYNKILADLNKIYM